MRPASKKKIKYEELRLLVSIAFLNLKLGYFRHPGRNNGGLWKYFFFADLTRMKSVIAAAKFDYLTHKILDCNVIRDTVFILSAVQQEVDTGSMRHDDHYRNRT